MTSPPPLPPAPPTYDPPSGHLPPPPPGPYPRPPLQRSRTNKVIGGVSGGLAEYTGVDALLWRVGFVAVTLAWGVGLIIYPLLWLLMPAGPVDPTAAVARAQRARGPRSPVPGITLAAVLILVGIGALLARFTALDLGARAFLGGALLVVGVGLAVAAVTGAGRGAKAGMIVLGVVLAFAAVAATTVRVPDVREGDRSYRPLTASDVQPQYDSGVGDLTLDLTAIDLADLGRPISVVVHSGIGDVDVIVPRSADVQVDVDNGLGDAEVFGRRSDNGYHPGTGGAAWTDDDDAEFRLTIESGIGDVEVSRG